MRRISGFVQTFFQSVAHLLYPPYCLHCEGDLLNPNYPFCLVCSEQFERIDPSSRCSRCFAEGAPCRSCPPRPFRLQEVAGACEYMGPAATLVKRLKEKEERSLAKGAAAFMVQQFIALKWPLPDVIVPVPISLIRYCDRGHNQSLLLAEEMGEILNRPVINALCRKSGGLKQAGLSQKQREQQHTHQFSLKAAGKTTEKVVLLVDDVLTTGTTLRNCAETLIEDLPLQVYAITFTAV